MGEGKSPVRPGPSLPHKQGRLAGQDGFGHLVSTQEPRRKPGEACEDTPANVGVSHQYKPLRCLGTARKADTTAMSPESTPSVPGNSVCSQSVPTPPTPSKVLLTLDTTSLSRPVWPR